MAKRFSFVPKKSNLDDKEEKEKKKSMAPLASPTIPPTDFVENPSLDEELVKEQIYRLLFEGNLDLLSTICKINQFGDGNSFAISIMTFLRYNGSAESFISRLLTNRIETSELVESKDLMNILRDNSMTVTLLNSYAKLEGTKYLKEVLTSPIDEIYHFAEKLDINMTGSENGAEESADFMVKAVDLILNSIVSNINALPTPFVRVCQLLDSECRKKLAKETNYTEDYINHCCLRLIGSFLFLRFYCPAITGPPQAGVTSHTNFSPEARKGFISLAKVFIGLGADHNFSASEGQLTPLNHRLANQKERARKYLSDLSTMDPSLSSPAPQPKNLQLQILLEPVILFLKKNIKKIEDLIKDREDLQFNFGEIKAQLEQLDSASKEKPNADALQMSRVHSIAVLPEGSSSSEKKKKPSEDPKMRRAVGSFLNFFQGRQFRMRASSMEDLKSR